MKSLILVCCFLILCTMPVYGDVYKWVDEKGTVHFADDLSHVPERYRPGAEKRTAPKESPSPRTNDRPVRPPAVSKTEESEGIVVNLHRRNELWLTEVLLNGRVRRFFILDSGASTTLLSWKTANELGILVDENTPVIPVTTVSGMILTPLVTLRTVQVGKAELENVEALIHTMPSDSDGLLGNSFLNKFRIGIDTLHGKLTLHALQGKATPDQPGGYGKDYWVGRFRFYHRSLSDLKRVKAGMEAGGSASELNRVKNAIRYFENQLDELDRRASFAGVPRNWRE